MIRWLYYFLRRIYYRKVYLRSRHWKQFRQEALKAANWECEFPGCDVVDPGKPNVERIKYYFPKMVQPLDVHHLHYRTLGRESLKDVSVLCRRHHEEIEREKYPH